MLGAGALGRPRGMEWGGRREEGSLGQEDLLEKGMVPTPVLAWRIPWTEEPGGLQSIELPESDMT